MPNKKIFLSYRSEDRPGYVGRLKDDLQRAFGEGRVFRDVEDIAGGSKWKEVLDHNLKNAAVLLLIIGPRWEAIWAARGKDSANYVAFELERAREIGVPVIPVTLDGTKLSPNIDLGGVSWLLDNQTYDISDRQGRWSTDVEGLVRLLEGIDAIGKSRSGVTKKPPSDALVTRKSGRVLGTAAAGIAMLWILWQLLPDNETYDQPAWDESLDYESQPVPASSAAGMEQDAGMQDVVHYPNITGVWQSQADATVYRVEQYDDGTFDIQSPGYANGQGSFFDDMPRKFEVHMYGVGRGEFSVSNSDQTVSGWMLENGSSDKVYDTLVRLK